MKKIMFSDAFCLTQAVLNGTKTMTRRVLKVPKTCNGKEVYSFNILTNSLGTQCVDLIDYDGNVLGSWKPHYEVGEVVAIAQPYKDIIECLPMYSNAILDEVGMPRKEFKAGWTNKMFVRADLLPTTSELQMLRWNACGIYQTMMFYVRVFGKWASCST